jgi:hypothetical protein
VLTVSVGPKLKAQWPNELLKRLAVAGIFSTADDLPALGPAPTRRLRIVRRAGPGLLEDGEVKPTSPPAVGDAAKSTTATTKSIDCLVATGAAEERGSGAGQGGGKRAKKAGRAKRKKEQQQGPKCKPVPPCAYFLRGRCAKGTECPFLHEGTPQRRATLCKFLLSGACTKGDECPFSHGLRGFLFRSDRVETKAFPCRFLYGRGSCTFGDKCRFSHEPTTTEELERVQAEWVGVQRRYGVEACGSSESGISGGIDELMEVAGDASNTQEQADAATDQSQSAESLWGGFAFRESLFGAGLR